MPLADSNGKATADLVTERENTLGNGGTSTEEPAEQDTPASALTDVDLADRQGSQRPSTRKLSTEWAPAAARDQEPEGSGTQRRWGRRGAAKLLSLTVNHGA